MKAVALPGPGSGRRYEGKIGSVLRNTPGGLVEVELDSMAGAGIGLVAFKPEELVPTDKKRMTRRHRFIDGRAELPASEADEGDTHDHLQQQ